MSERNDFCQFSKGLRFDDIASPGMGFLGKGGRPTKLARDRFANDFRRIDAPIQRYNNMGPHQTLDNSTSGDWQH